MRIIITGILLGVLINFPGCLTDAGTTEEDKPPSVLASKEDIGKIKKNLKRF